MSGLFYVLSKDKYWLPKVAVQRGCAVGNDASLHLAAPSVHLIVSVSA